MLKVTCIAFIAVLALNGCTTSKHYNRKTGETMTVTRFMGIPLSEEKTKRSVETSDY